MMVSRFFFPAELPVEGEAALPEVLAHHAIKVLRLRDGEPLVLFDGRGGEVPARLAVRGRQCFAVLGARSAVERESPLDLVLAQGLAGGEKMDWIIQKATELGVAGVVPLAAERSVMRLAGERAARRVAHWRQVAVAACEQCGRNRVPEVTDIQPVERWLAGARAVRKLVLAPGKGRRVRELAPLAAGERVVLMVGPEGGWTDAELAACRSAGAEAMSLGPRVLRTETAGLAALAALQAFWGDA